MVTGPSLSGIGIVMEVLSFGNLHVSKKHWPLCLHVYVFISIFSDACWSQHHPTISPLYSLHLPTPFSLSHSTPWSFLQLSCFSFSWFLHRSYMLGHSLNKVINLLLSVKFQFLMVPLWKECVLLNRIWFSLGRYRSKLNEVSGEDFALELEGGESLKVDQNLHVY